MRVLIFIILTIFSFTAFAQEFPKSQGEKIKERMEDMNKDRERSEKQVELLGQLLNEQKETNNILRQILSNQGQAVNTQSN